MCRSGDMTVAANVPKRVNSWSWREEDTSDPPVTLTPRAPGRGREDRADPSLPTIGEFSSSRRSEPQGASCCATGGGEGVPHLLFGPRRRADPASAPVRGAGRVGSSIVDSLGADRELYSLESFNNCGSSTGARTTDPMPLATLGTRSHRQGFWPEPCGVIRGAPQCEN